MSLCQPDGVLQSPVNSGLRHTGFAGQTGLAIPALAHEGPQLFHNALNIHAKIIAYRIKKATLGQHPTIATRLMDATAHDHQIRRLLKAHLAERITAEDLLLDEFQLAFGAVRADLALVNGHLEGFEIKAGKDTLTRLPHQIDAYSKVFEFSWVVTTKYHLHDVRRLVPKEWGLLVAHTDGTTLKPVRAAKRNTRRDANHLARLLWRGELMAKLDELGASKGLKSKPKIALYAALAASLPVAELAEYVRACLKTRAGWRADEGPRECGGSSRRVSTA
jgi:hypothetical protein